MVTVQVTLRDETYERLRIRAEEQGVPVDQLIAAAMEADAGGEVSPEFLELVQRQLQQYRRTFERLGE